MENKPFYYIKEYIIGDENQIQKVTYKPFTPMLLMEVYNYQAALHMVQFKDDPWRLTCVKTGCYFVKGNTEKEVKAKLQELLKIKTKIDFVIQVTTRAKQLAKAEKLYENHTSHNNN